MLKELSKGAIYTLSNGNERVSFIKKDTWFIRRVYYKGTKIVSIMDYKDLFTSCEEEIEFRKDCGWKDA